MKKIFIILISLLFISCAKYKEPDYMNLSEERIFCHMQYHNSIWIPHEMSIPIYLIYNEHVIMHPNDYWGRCK